MALAPHLAPHLAQCPVCGQLYQPDAPTAAPDPRADDAWQLTPLGWASAVDRDETLRTEARAQLRDLLRDFLASTPESEPDALLELRWPDGSIRQVSRGQLTARTRWLRPRQRRIIEQRYVAHRTRYDIVDEMGCSMKTYERDLVGALDLLLMEATPAPADRSDC